MILICISDFPFLPYYLNAINCRVIYISLKMIKEKTMSFTSPLNGYLIIFSPLLIIHLKEGGKGRGGGRDNVDQ